MSQMIAQLKNSGKIVNPLNEHHIISHTHYGPAYALSATEVVKSIHSNSMSELKLEAEKLKYAKNRNNLLVKFIRTDTINGINVLVTERHYPMQSRAF